MAENGTSLSVFLQPSSPNLNDSVSKISLYFVDVNAMCSAKLTYSEEEIVHRKDLPKEFTEIMH